MKRNVPYLDLTEETFSSSEASVFLFSVFVVVSYLERQDIKNKSRAYFFDTIGLILRTN